MLDIEVVIPPTDTALDVVSVEEMARHIRLSPNAASTALWQGILTDAITDAVDKLDGIGGELNRTILRRTYRRYFSRFPSGKCSCIQLPYPPLVRVLSINIGDEDSPPEVVSPSSYVVKPGGIIGLVEAKSSWPHVAIGPRAASITYEAGYAEFPPKLKRMVKFLAAHYIENSEATVLEQNKTLIDRRVLFAMDDLRAALRVPPSYDDFE